MTGDNDTITLKDAAKHFGFSVYTLRNEADHRRLKIYKIGNKYYTTPADIRNMVELCHVEQKARVSISTHSARRGTSETDRTSAALAAANEIATALKSSSRGTSARSTNQNRRARP